MRESAFTSFWPRWERWRNAERNTSAPPYSMERRTPRDGPLAPRSIRETALIWKAIYRLFAMRSAKRRFWEPGKRERGFRLSRRLNMRLHNWTSDRAKADGIRYNMLVGSLA